MNEALLIVDMQKYFYNLDSKIFDKKIIPNLHKKLSECRSNDIKIIHIRTVYAVDKVIGQKQEKENQKYGV